MAFTPLGDGGTTLSADTYTLTQAGTDIEKNATSMGSDFQKHWNTFDSVLTSLPKHLQNMLNPYKTARKSELDNLVQRRQKVGQILQKASDLISFNEQAKQSVFQNLMILDSSGQSSTTNLTPPNGWIQREK